MTSYWKFSLPMIHNSFESIDEPVNVKWHDGPFKGHGSGLKDNNAPKDLQKEILNFDEVKGVHEVMKNDPDYFFNTHDNLWFYTGGSGKAPDVVGFGADGNVVIGEIKWLRGWHKELPKQIESYLDLFHKKSAHRTADIRIAATQTLPKNTKDEILNMWKTRASNWSLLGLYFGFLQVGWSKSSPHRFYLKCEWIEQ